MLSVEIRSELVLGEENICQEVRGSFASGGPSDKPTRNRMWVHSDLARRGSKLRLRTTGMPKENPRMRRLAVVGFSDSLRLESSHTPYALYRRTITRLALDEDDRLSGKGGVGQPRGILTFSFQSVAAPR